MRSALLLLALLVSLELLLALQAKKKEKKNQPHIIFILIDDQGFNDIGYHNPSIQTPTLDKLAAEGVKLENYYVQPICTPTRSQLLTGRYQIHTGLQHSIIRPSQPSCLPPHLDTLPQRLRQAGYSTHMVGKWHLGFYKKACLPTRKGFDSFFGSLTGSVDYYSYGSCDGPGLCGYDLHEDEKVMWGQEGKYSTTLFTQRARKILEGHDPSERPLFLLLSLQAVHTPLQAPKSSIYPYRDMANVSRRRLAAMLSTVDAAVRNVTFDLRRLGYYHNSVLVYSTDNGAAPFTGGSNWPLRGRKGTYWEGGVRGVAFVHSPLLRRRKRVSNALMHVTDWFPTLVGLGGGDLSQSPGLDGFDVWAAISEGAESPRHEILHNIDPLHKPIQTSSWEAFKVRPSKDPETKNPKKKKKKKKRKKKKKKILRQKPKQKSVFRLKTTRNPPASPRPSQPQTRVLYRPPSKTRSSLDPPRNVSFSQKLSGFKSALKESKELQVSTSQWRFVLQQNSSQSGPSQSQSGPSQIQFRLPRSQSELSQSGTFQSGLSQFGASQVWDTSVQAAIRVGDWKLLTGDPGHGDWVPPQVLPSLPGQWWNLERTSSSETINNVWLFNISADPFERSDVSSRRPDVVLQLLSRLAFYNRTAVPVHFPPDDPRANPRRHGGAWVPWEEEEESEGGKYQDVNKEDKTKSKKKCPLCKLKAFFLKLNTGMMSDRI